MGTAKTQQTERVADLLSQDEIIGGRYLVVSKLGQGAFGQIFMGRDKNTSTEVAIKTEPHYDGNPCNDPRRLILEKNVLIALRSVCHIPLIYACGKTKKQYHYIVMQLLGRNLTDLRKERDEKKFSAKTAFRAAIQIIYALKALHEVGYVHRDVKPSNCCTGIGRRIRTVYLIDFGMCRRIITKDGKRRPLREKCEFRGTIRYATLEVLRTGECGPCDDVVGWLYSTIEIYLSAVPWAKVTPREMVVMKQTLKDEEVCEGMPYGFLQCYKYAIGVTQEEMPNYNHILDCYQECLPSGTKADDPYDWEELQNSHEVSSI
ncbi:hypothetical protein AB6A40_005712 [Gnathostoma spinigerum]|uniref:non-specific serine/threonine protein kinase n=1 Tax=Gnathostoma spinigerum TaxID=75299 RepID=A0ABD6EPS5_9BILA